MRAPTRVAILTLVLALLAGCAPGATPTAVAPTPAPATMPSPTARPQPGVEPALSGADGAPPAVTASRTSAGPTTETGPTQAPAMVEITVYFTDVNRYAAGTPPFEVAVTRLAPAGANLPQAVLTEFFKGPTAEERSHGLVRIDSGFTGFDALTVEGDIARVHLTGPCASNGATYSVAQLLLKNLLQFPAIEYVKIYDADGNTEQPDGPTSSIPFCLEP